MTKLSEKSAQHRHPSVLVLMATFNGERFIEEQLESVFAQQNVSVEVLVRDDGSVDDTLTILEKLRAQRQLTLVQRTLGTGGVCRNFMELIKLSEQHQFEYLAFCDQDDVWHPLHCSRGIQALNENQGDLYSGPVEAFWVGGKRKVLRQSRSKSAYDFIFEGGGQGCSYILTSDFACHLRSFIEANSGLLVKARYHDWITYIYCRVSGRRWVYGEAVCLEYRQHEFNDTGGRGSFLGFKSRVKQVMDGSYWIQCGIALEVATVALRDRESNASSLVLPNDVLDLRSLINGRRSKSERLILMVLGCVTRLIRAVRR